MKNSYQPRATVWALSQKLVSDSEFRLVSLSKRLRILTVLRRLGKPYKMFGVMALPLHEISRQKVSMLKSEDPIKLSSLFGQNPFALRDDFRRQSTLQLKP